VSDTWGLAKVVCKVEFKLLLIKMSSSQLISETVQLHCRWCNRDLTSTISEVSPVANPDPRRM